MSAKKARKFNIIDAVVIVVLAALVAAIVLAALSDLGVSGTSTKIQYVLETENLSNEFTSKVAVGDGVFSYEDAKRIGTVTAVSKSPARYEGTDSEGLPVSSEIDGCSILYITVEADGESGNTGYTVAGTVINTGRELEVRLPSLYCNARCISVSAIEE